MSDIVDKFSTHLKNVLTRALCFVVETNQKTIQPEHLLWALGTQKGCIGAEVLKKVGVKKTDLKKLVGAKQTVAPVSSAHDLTLHLSDDAKRMVEKAVLTANVYGHRYVGTEHLLSGIVQINPEVTATFFEQTKTDLKELKNQLNSVLKSTSKFPELTDNLTKDPSSQLNPTQDQHTHPHADQRNDQKESALEFFGVELTSKEEASRIDPVIGRAQEIERVMEILARRTKNNPLLLGEPGVGKTAIVEGLAKRIVEGNIPALLKNKRIFAIDLALLIAGTMYRGEFEGRLKQIVNEAKENPDIILFIDEIHTIVGAGATAGSMDAANILKPALARGQIRCIGATTPAEFKKHIEADAALERRFQNIHVEEPNAEKALEILEGLAPHYESFHRVRITHDALQNAIALSQRYVQDKFLPDKAIDLIDEAAAAIKIRNTDATSIQKEREAQDALARIQSDKRQAVIEERFEDAMRLKEEEARLSAYMESLQTEENGTPTPVVTNESIARVLSRSAGIPLEDLLSTDLTRLLSLEDQLRERVLGQESAINVVAGALRRAKTGIAHPSRPLASFLFLGPSGVGKTELAKTIAKNLFHSDKHFIRLDMSEYAEGFTMSKLIGAPAGYVGYKEGANLTDRVKQRPYSVILFDEIEKAHRDVQNLLLQILEEGELTDATGRKINFKNTIIILTSNVGLERFERGDLGFLEDTQARTMSLTDDIRTELAQRFRPELVNRIDHTCMFQPLTNDILDGIVQKQLNELEERLRDQGLSIHIHKDIVPHIRTLAEPKYGARNIRSHIQKEIEHKIAERISKKDRPKKLRVKLNRKNVHVTRMTG